MSLAKKEAKREDLTQIAWCPYHDHEFITWGQQEIRLYSDEEGEFTCIGKRSDPIFTSAVVAWYPRNTPNRLVAIGQQNGTVSLRGVLENENDFLWNNSEREFNVAPNRSAAGPRSATGPRSQRRCVGVAWNPHNPSLLAVGLDKSKGKDSLSVWDVSLSTVRGQGGSKAVDTFNRNKKLVAKTAEVPGPIDLNSIEGVVSLAWIPNSAYELVAGIGSKWLRLYDIRKAPRESLSVHSPGTSCLAVDQSDPTMVASFTKTENAIKIWDLRNKQVPVCTIPDVKKISHLEWCPTRPSLLAALSKDSSQTILYDLHMKAVSKDSGIVIFPTTKQLHRTIEDHDAGEPGSKVTGLNWHPRKLNRLLCVTKDGALEDTTVREGLTSEFSAKGELATAYGPTLNLPIKIPGLEMDISQRMKSRANAEYGLNVDKNLEICEDESEVYHAWLWMKNQLSHAREFMGVEAALTADPKLLPAAKTGSTIQYDQSIIINVYDSRSPQRSYALFLCEWSDLGDESALEDRMLWLEKRGEYERAAALALFHHRIRRAITSLTRGAQEVDSGAADTLTTAAMSLSGYTPESNDFSQQIEGSNLWRDTCVHLTSRLSNPYLRAAFHFLTCTDGTYQEVLMEDLKVVDKIAFACRYLPDQQLHEFVAVETKKAAERGHLDGLILTGFSAGGMDLLGSYVDRTADVQTAVCLLTMAIANLAPGSAVQHHLLNDPRQNTWVETYRNLLDQWEMWFVRAKFDVDQKPLNIPQQVDVICNFCYKSLAHAGPRLPKKPQPKLQKPVSVACPYCRKPLPRCTLCLLRLGTSAPESKKKSASQKPHTSQFDNWFTWCQECRHGGHAGHIAEWFLTHSQCPVAGCICNCNAHDQNSQKQVAIDNTEDG